MILNDHYISIARKMLCSAFCLAVCTTAAFASDDDDDDDDDVRPEPYAYNSTLEVSVGSSRNLHIADGLADHGMALFGTHDRGFDLMFRFSHFVTPHWGVYAMLQNSIIATESCDIEDNMNSRLRNHNDPGTYSLYESCGWHDYSVDYGRYILGAVYRYESGPWSIRPRLGIGLATIDADSKFDYYYHNPSTLMSDGTYQYVKTWLECNPDANFSAGGNTQLSFAYHTSLQLTLTPRRHMFFSFETAFTGIVGKIAHNTETTVMRLKQDPEDTRDPSFLVGEINSGYIYPAGEFSHGERIEKLPVEHRKVRIGDILNFNFGVGWNFGHRR